MPQATMNQYPKEQPYSQTLLVVNSDERRLDPNSPILASLNLVSIPTIEAVKVLSWVQQYQPDLIILNLGWTQIINLQLIAALRLDWLTRNIPIMVISGATSITQKSLAKLDYDTYLSKPYSTKELEQAICSLLPIPACEAHY